MADQLINTKHSLIIFFLGIFLWLLTAGLGHANVACEQWLAKGDGFQVTPRDVSELADIFRQQNIMTSQDQYTQAAIKFRLYQAEAARLELAPETSSGFQDGMAGVIQKAEQYLQWVLEGQEIPDRAIQSYFRSNPNRFINPDGSPRELTDEIRNNIRRHIINARRTRIDAEVFEELKTRYNVRICVE